MEFINLPEIQERILAYLKSKEKNTGYNGADNNEISVFLGTSRSATTNNINSLKEKKYLMIKREGKKAKYLITSEGRDYLNANIVEEIPADEVKSMTFEESKQVKETIEELEKIKTEFSDLKNEYEKRLFELEKNINDKISNFYGRIGEILALIITAIAMIVFNIQLIGSVEIDYKEPMKAAQTILAIDLPYIVLFTIFILIFHIIIGRGEKKEVKVKDVRYVLVKSLPILIIIIACLIFIA